MCCWVLEPSSVFRFAVVFVVVVVLTVSRSEASSRLAFFAFMFAECHSLDFLITVLIIIIIIIVFVCFTVFCLVSFCCLLGRCLATLTNNCIIITVVIVSRNSSVSIVTRLGDGRYEVGVLAEVRDFFNFFRNVQTCFLCNGYRVCFPG